MNLKNLTVSLLILFLVSCASEKLYVPDGLTKLTRDELIERVKKNQTPDFTNVTYKNENGETLTLDFIQNLPNPENWITDSYVDKNGVVKEMILREATEEDKAFLIDVMAAYQDQPKPPIETIDIDCEKKGELLDEVYALDQGMRSTDGLNDYDPEVDRQNLIKVVSLIETCGMPTTGEVSQQQMDAIWLVFQHADNYNSIRKDYFPILENSAEDGDLSKSKIALMQDRIKMTDGEPQIYGSQIVQNMDSGEWMIYDLMDPKTVDKRRREVGLESLSEYVKQWNIEFTVEQSE